LPSAGIACTNPNRRLTTKSIGYLPDHYAPMDNKSTTSEAGADERLTRDAA